jgi:hypothetical protein
MVRLNIVTLYRSKARNAIFQIFELWKAKALNNPIGTSFFIGLLCSQLSSYWWFMFIHVSLSFSHFTYRYWKKFDHSHYAYFAFFHYQHTLFYDMEIGTWLFEANLGYKLCEPCRENNGYRASLSNMSGYKDTYIKALLRLQQMYRSLRSPLCLD